MTILPAAAAFMIMIPPRKKDHPLKWRDRGESKAAVEDSPSGFRRRASTQIRLLGPQGNVGNGINAPTATTESRRGMMWHNWLRFVSSAEGFLRSITPYAKVCQSKLLIPIASAVRPWEPLSSAAALAEYGDAPLRA
jgi:hypothetical protein